MNSTPNFITTLVIEDELSSESYSFRSMAQTIRDVVKATQGIPCAWHGIRGLFGKASKVRVEVETNANGDVRDVSVHVDRGGRVEVYAMNPSYYLREVEVSA